MLRVIHVGHVGHNAGDGAVLGGGGGGENGDARVAGVVAGAADAVHDGPLADVGGVDVARQIHLNGGVHGDDAQAADHLGGVAELLGPEDDLALVVVDMGIEPLPGGGGDGEGRAAGAGHLARVDELHHRVLHDLGIDAQVLQLGAGQGGEHRVGHAAHTGLHGGQRIGQTAGRHFAL